MMHFYAPVVALSFFMAGTTAFCPAPGALLPPPKVTALAPKFDIPESAFKDLPWTDDTSFVVQASVGGVNVFQHEYSAPGREVEQPLFGTKFRVGSVTKTFTMLAVLLSADKMSMDDPITKFIPDLNEEAYGKVTIGALASHTSGLGRYIYTADLAVIPGFKPSDLGLPAVNNTLPGCDPFPGGRICSRPEVLDGFNNPAYFPRSPNSGPLYSNVGYNLLGMALAAVHGKSSEEVIKELIIDPLNLQKTTFDVPADDGSAILPRKPADAGWFVSKFGNYNPSGGLWSTSDDILTFLHALLQNKLLDKAKTRRWLQPRAMLPSLQQLVGESWEIDRPIDLDVANRRPIDVFTKAGGVTGYAAYAAIVPEYDIALTINTAGGKASAASSALLPLLVRPLVAYADKLARSQAAAVYAGTYNATSANSTNSMTLSVDDGPGLAITSLTVNNVPVLRSLAAIQGIPFENFSARLYPTDPDSLGSGKESWRILLDNKDREIGFAESQCASWNWGDFNRYVAEPLDTIVFTMESTGAVGVELLGWRAKLDKV